MIDKPKVIYRYSEASRSACGRFVNSTIAALLLGALAIAQGAVAQSSAGSTPQADRYSGAVTVGKAKMIVGRPFPQFTLYTDQDQAITSQTLVQPGYWLIVYRDRKCTQCDALMQTLSLQGDNISHVVIVVSDISGANLLLLEQQYPKLDGAEWLRDVKHNFSTSMGIVGTPHIVGVRDNSIRWQREGVSADDTLFPAAIQSWLKYNALPPNKFVRNKLKAPTDQKAASTPTPAPQGNNK